MPVRLGGAVFDQARGTVLGRDGKVVKLRPKAFRLLGYLAENVNTTLARKDLIEFVWPGLHVTEDSLTQLIREIRRAVGDPGGALLQTVPGRGYLLALQGQDERRPDQLEPIPQLSTSFIGRQAELAALGDLVAAHRLVTIVGMGGVGKTRVLLQLAAGLAEAGRRVFRIDLAPVREPSAVALTVANGVGAGLPASEPRQAVVAALRDREAILMIDNAEHVLAEVGALLGDLLTFCPVLSIVVTSRVSLGVAGERVFRLSPLPLPPADAGATAAAVMGYDSVRLFVDRASMLMPGFDLSEAGPDIVAAICRKLDGIALAIEMAVPRLQVLTAAQFLHRLDQRFDILTATADHALPRQRSLLAMLEWSWELLRPPEQALLLRMGVFVGSVTLQALVDMMDEEAMPEWSVLDALTALVGASLVISCPTDQEPRYRLLETTRQFALRRLTPEMTEALRLKHLAVVSSVFEAADREWACRSSRAWIQQYGPDADNVRAALHWSFGAGHQVEAGLRLVSVSLSLWWELPSFPLRESRGWFDLAVSRIGPETPPDVQARLWLGCSWRDVQIGDRANRPAADRAIELFRMLDDPIGLGAALWRGGCSMLLYETLGEAEPMLIEAEQLLRRCPPSKWLTLTLVRRGNALAQRQDYAGAKRLYDEALRLGTTLDYWFGEMLAVTSLAEVLNQSGEPDAGLRHMSALRGTLPRGVRIPLVSTLATHLASAGRGAEAMDAIREVLDDSASMGLTTAMARAIETLAMLLAEAGQPEAAARLLGYVLTHHPASRNRTGGRLGVYKRLVAALGAASLADIEGLKAEGASWSEGEALAAANRHRGLLPA